MKYAVFAFMLCLASLWVIVKIYQGNMTPERQAAEDVWVREQTKIAAQAEAERGQRIKRRAEEISSQMTAFSQELLAKPGVEDVTFIDGEVFRVKLAPELHNGEHHVRVLCEQMAHLWAVRSGRSYARCESWYGNKMYASGKYLRK